MTWRNEETDKALRARCRLHQSELAKKEVQKPDAPPDYHSVL